MLSLGNKLTLNTQPIYKFVNKYSIDFDGVDDRIITDDADTVAQPTTYSFWAKTSQTTQNFVFGHGHSFYGSFALNQGNKPLLWLDGSYFRYWNNVPQQDDGEWHHWVLYADTNDITNSKLYCDGVLQIVESTVSSSSTFAYTESLTIGATKASGGNMFLGKIDEFAVYDRELTQDEITRMYNTYYSPNRVANGNFAQIGNEEVTNGDFSQIGSEEVTGFTNGTTYPFTTFTTSGNNITSAIVSSAFAGAVSNAISVTSGKIYKVTFDYTKNSGDDLRVVFSSVVSGAGTQISNSELISASGSYTKYFTITSTTTGYLQMGTGNSGHSLNASITNISVKEVGQDWTVTGSDSTHYVEFLSTGARFVSDTVSPVLELKQNAITSGKQYVLTCNVAYTGAGQLRVNVGSNLTAFTEGANTRYFTATSGTMSFLRENANVDALLSNVSVKEVGQHWTFGTGWSMGDGVAICDGSQTSNSNLLQNTGVPTVGKTFKMSYKVSNHSAGAAFIGMGGYDYAATDITGDGQFTQDITVTNASSNTNFYITASSNFAATIDNIVIEELKHDATNLMLNAGDYQSANPLITSTKSMEFDGSDQLLTTQADTVAQNTTYSFWTKTSTTSRNVVFGHGGVTIGCFSFNYDGNRPILRTGDAKFLYFDDVTQQEDDKWHHWVVYMDYVDLTNSKLYCDGVLQNVDQTSNTGTINAYTQPLTIGADNQAGDNEYEGLITEFGTWDRELTSLEVASLYNQGMPTNLLVNRNNYQSGNPTVFNTKQVDFDGTDDHLKANSTLGSFTGSITSWVKRNSVASVWRYITDFRANSGGGYFAINNSHNIDVPSGTVYVDNVATTVVPQDTEWHHIVVTGITLNITESIIFGSRHNIIDVFDGKMSQIGLWNTTLTADEVSSLYNHGLPIDLTTNQAAYESSSNLVGYWRMGSGTLDTYPLIADQTNATLGNELITNGDFASDTWWQKSSANVNISNGKGNYTGGTTEYFYKNNTLEIGKTYKLVFEITDYTTGYISAFGGNWSGPATAVGTWEKYFTCVNTTFGLVGNSFIGSIDNVTVKQVNGNPAIMTNQTSSDIENGSPYANIVQDSDFTLTGTQAESTNGTYWDTGAGWTIANNKATSNGTVDNLDGISLETGKNYKATVTVSNMTTGNLSYRLGGASSNEILSISSNGEYTAYGVAGGTVLRLRSQNGFDGSVTNITISEVNTGLQGYWKMGDGTNDEYPVIFDQTNPTLSAELVTNGSFATDSDWTYGDGWNIEDGFAKCNGTQTGNSIFYQNLGDLSNKTVKLTFTISNFGGGELETSFFGASGTTVYEVTANGDYTFYINVQSGHNGNTGFTANSSFIGYVDNVSVKEVQGNFATMTNMVEGNITNQYPLTKIRNYYRMGDGILDGYPIIQDQTSPNLAHIPTTNLVPNSNTFSSVSSTLTPNYGISPDGSQNSTRVQASGTNSGIRITISDSSNNAYAYSVFVKGISGETVNVRVETSPYSLLTQYNFELNGEWQRIESVLTASNTHTQKNFYVTKLGSSTATDFQVYGSQIEKQSQATAYIKSDGIAAVRKSSTTNLVNYSEDFSQSDWNKQNISITPNYSTSPFGTNNATRFLTTSNVASFLQVLSLSILNSTSYTISVYAKSNNGLNKFRFYTSTAGTSSEFTTTSDWQRFEFNITSTGTSSNIGLRGVSGSETDIIIFGFQIEEQTQAETYAKTTGLPVTIDLFTENNYGTMTNQSSSDIVEDTP